MNAESKKRIQKIAKILSGLRRELKDVQTDSLSSSLDITALRLDQAQMYLNSMIRKKTGRETSQLTLF